ncbi:hypothetical protein MIMGU_mgv1a017494mg [Erythranthe guttata]|uniref:Uncharacterized protein n=1 Tax=Erythranthe guttata TaxID=4155 RepID=A0A022PUN9_ERYGU|nr:hypothetical protein MIMGU_mgv1a017494mg [Erythranthe guttata]
MGLTCWVSVLGGSAHFSYSGGSRCALFVLHFNRLGARVNSCMKSIVVSNPILLEILLGAFFMSPRNEVIFC